MVHGGLERTLWVQAVVYVTRACQMLFPYGDEGYGQEQHWPLACGLFVCWGHVEVCVDVKLEE